MSEEIKLSANLIYGVKQFIPPTYTEYKIKRDGLFGKKKLNKILSGVFIPRCHPDIDLAVCDNGCLIGTEEAMKMYREYHND